MLETYEDFSRLINDHEEFTWVRGKKFDVGGGVFDISEIDQIDEYENIDRIMLSGLTQAAFEYFIQKYGPELKYVKFFKNKFIEDMSPLAALENVVYIDFFFNQRATKLWNMEKNKNLIGLAFNDFSRLHSLEGLETAPSLKYLDFGDMIWSTSILSDLESLLKTNLVGFSFGGKSIEKNDIMLFSKIKSLRYFDCPSNLYSTEDLARLVAARPDLQGYALRPFIKFDRDSSDIKDVLICGRRKPFLFSIKDHDRIEKYTANFERLVEEYRAEFAGNNNIH